MTNNIKIKSVVCCSYGWCSKGNSNFPYLLQSVLGKNFIRQHTENMLNLPREANEYSVLAMVLISG